MFIIHIFISLFFAAFIFSHTLFDLVIKNAIIQKKKCIVKQNFSKKPPKKPKHFKQVRRMRIARNECTIKQLLLQLLDIQCVPNLWYTCNMKITNELILAILFDCYCCYGYFLMFLFIGKVSNLLFLKPFHTGFTPHSLQVQFLRVKQFSFLCCRQAWWIKVYYGFWSETTWRTNPMNFKVKISRAVHNDLMHNLPKVH